MITIYIIKFMDLEELTVYLFFVSNMLGLFIVFFGHSKDALFM